MKQSARKTMGFWPEEFSRQHAVFLAALVALFLTLIFPLIQGRTSKENVAERQAQNAGMVRMYCRYDGYSPVLSPNIPFGLHPFNVEFSFFEWAQGRVSRAIDGPACDSVEVVGRVTSATFSALSILLIFVLALRLAGPWPAMICALALVSDFLWIKFSTFILVENRMLFCALLAMYCMLVGRAPNERPGRASALYNTLQVMPRLALGTVLWFLTITQKPQAFAFIAPFYVVLELVLFFCKFEPQQKNFFSVRRVQAAASVLVALLAGAAYFAWSGRVNTQGDVPWLVWTGPTVMKWFFGGFHERFEWPFYKSIFLDWFKKTGVNFSLPALVLLYFAGSAKMHRRAVRSLAKKVLLLSLPFLAGRFFQVLVFLNVYKVHDYYALAGNVLACLTKGLLLGLVLEAVLEGLEKQDAKWNWPKTAYSLAAVLLVSAVFIPGSLNLKRFTEFSEQARTPGSSTYQNEFDLKLFPKDAKFVVVAHLARGRDYTYLYLSKREGHIWCSWNKKFAPRAFWKKEGVQYVAWQEGFDPVQSRAKFVVRTLNEELAIARKNGWSSDVNDIWASKTMAQWAALASRKFLDPCIPGQEDPRKW